MFNPMSMLAAMAAAVELGQDPTEEACEEILRGVSDMGIDLDSFGAPRSNQEVINAHNKSLRYMLKQLGSASRGDTFISTSSSWDTKPVDEFPSVPPFAALAPIACADLAPQTTHRGRVLKGKLVVEAVLMTGVASVLEDEHGDVVKVAFYNFPELQRASGPEGNFPRAFQAAQRLFPKGQAVAIIEPYFKIMTDGSPGVRVDNPAEVVFLDSLEESPEALQQRGNKHVAAHQYKEAVSCYDRALLSLQQPGQQPGQLLLSVLLNLSATHLQLQQPAHALMFAAAAVAFSCHKSSKAYYRAAMALDQLLGPSGGSNGGISGSSSGNNGSIAAGRLIAAATELMEESVRLTGNSNTGAKAQMLAALTNVAAAKAAQTSSGSSKKGAAARSKASAQGEWQVVCEHLGASMQQLRPLFTLINSSDGVRSSSDGLAAAEKAKEAGNTAFKAGSFSAALSHYQAAFASLQSLLEPTNIPELLSSRAQAWLKQPSKHSQQQAVLDAFTAALLHPASAAGFHTAAVALLQLEDSTGALAVCEVGRELLPQAEVLQELLQRIQAAAAAAAAAAAPVAEPADKAEVAPAASSAASSSASSSSLGSSSSSGKKGRQQASGASSSSSSGASSSSSRGQQPKPMTEREVKDFMNEGVSEVEQVAMMNHMLAMAERMGGRGGRGRGKALPEWMKLDERAPKLHEEFGKAGRWPSQVDVEWARRKLWEGYELARSQPQHIMMLMNKKFVAPQQLLPRLGSLNRDRVEWLLDAEVGSVSFPEEYMPYSGSWQSFTNAPARPEVLTPGTTHVAVGFVDLGALAAASEVLAARGMGSSSSSSSSSSRSGQPLRWVGYEMNAVCVAKTLVLLEMVQQQAAVDQVLQVWYSSTWSHSTLEAFRQAVSALLTAAAAIYKAPPQQRRSLHPSAEALANGDVLGLLRVWQVKQVTLAGARQGWQDSAHESFMWLCNFDRKCDRMALCEYGMTGELRALGPGDVGSVVMFAVPAAKFGERSFDEHVLQTLPYLTLTEAWRSEPDSDVLAVGVGLLRRRTGTLMRMLQDGLIKTEVHVGAVTLENQAAVTFLKSLQPYTVSWSNVPDYMHPRDFHKLARTISAPEDTVHFLHSMNWIKVVKGSCHLDYMLCMKEDALQQFMPEIKAAGDKSVGLGYQLFGLQKLLISPPFDSCRNLVDYCFFLKHFRGYVKAFFEHSLSGIRLPNRQVHLAEPPTYSVFARTNSTIHVTFTYDPTINFTPMTGQF